MSGSHLNLDRDGTGSEVSAPPTPSRPTTPASFGSRSVAPLNAVPLGDCGYNRPSLPGLNAHVRDISHPPASTREFPNADHQQTTTEQAGGETPRPRLAEFLEGYSPRRCMQCGTFHSLMNPYRCEAEIASHSVPVEHLGPHVETCKCQRCYDARMKRAVDRFYAEPMLSPIFEEAVEQLANAGAIR